MAKNVLFENVKLGGGKELKGKLRYCNHLNHYRKHFNKIV